MIGNFKNNLELKGFRGDVRINAGLVNDELKPAESIAPGESRTAGPKYVKGVNENFVFRGFIISPYPSEYECHTHNDCWEREDCSACCWSEKSAKKVCMTAEEVYKSGGCPEIPRIITD